MSRSSPALVTLIADTREQEPYSFDSRLVLVERRALPAGDYSVAGMESVVAVEREVLLQVLKHTRGNKAKAARLLLIDYKTIHTKLKQFGINQSGGGHD